MESKNSANLIQSSIVEKPLILAVDEDEDNILVISYAIESLACKIITTNNGQDTLTTANKYLPNLILLEIVLPDCDGFEIIKQLKQNKLTQNIPIIIVTRLSGTREREKIESLGCNGYLCKPYLFEELEAAIHPYLKIISKNYSTVSEDDSRSFRNWLPSLQKENF